MFFEQSSTFSILLLGFSSFIWADWIIIASVSSFPCACVDTHIYYNSGLFSSYFLIYNVDYFTSRNSIILLFYKYNVYFTFHNDYVHLEHRKAECFSYWTIRLCKYFCIILLYHLQLFTKNICKFIFYLFINVFSYWAIWKSFSSCW